MKNALRNALLALVLASAPCFADVQSDLANMYEKNLSASTVATLTATDMGFHSFVYRGKIDKKYPTYKTYKPGPGTQVITVLCGSQDITGINLVEKSEQLTTLIPLRRTSFAVGAPTFKLDEKFEGIYETILGRGVHNLVNSTLGNKKEFKGSLIIDDYNRKNCMPMYFKLGSIKDFQAFRAYLQPKLQEQAVKPLLLLTIDEATDKTFSADDVAFLNKYFTLLDPNNALVREFITKNNASLADAENKCLTAVPAGEKMSDLVLNSLEKVLGKFKYENLAMTALGLSLAGLAVPKLWNMAADVVLGKTKNPDYKEDLSKQPYLYDKNRSKFFKNVMYGTLGVSAAAITLSMLNEANKESLARNAAKAAKAA